MNTETVASAGFDGRLPPGPGVVRTLHGLSGDVIGFFLRCFREYGEVVRLPYFGRHAMLFVHPDDVGRVLKKDLDTYSKGGLGYPELKQVLGNGLGPTMGELWRRQRKMAQRGFSPKHIEGYAPGMLTVAQAYAERWQAIADRGGVIDLGEEMLQLILRTSCRTLIGTAQPDDQLHRVSHNFVHVVQDMERRVGRLWSPPLWMPTPGNRKLKRTFAEIYAFIESIIAQRRADPNPPDDLLGHLMQGSGDPEDAKIPNLLRDHVLNFFFGGHETSGYTLTWLFYLLGRHPEVDAKVHAEIQAVLGDRPPTAADAPRLVYTMQAIQETLRLYPIFPMLPRRCLRDDEVRGYRIPAGSYVNICPYLVHRHPDFWPEPEAFKPERFDPEIKHPQFAYIPFGGGPSVCIGRNFGMLSTLLTFVTLRQRFRLAAVDPRPVDYLPPGFHLQPARPIHMRLLLANSAAPAPLPIPERKAGRCPFHRSAS